jgi:hypothetical protein
MKTPLLRLFALTAVFASTAALQAADDLNAVFQRGRAAFYQGDYETAKVYLTQVATAAPNHTETQNLLRYINAHGKNVAASPQQTYATVMLPKVDFADVSLTEAIEGLRLLSKNASQGRITPNVIVKGTAVNEKKFSLTLNNIPLSQALEYAAQQCGGRLTYDKHAAIISDYAQAEPSNAAPASPAK